MAQTNYTPISLYYSTTASAVPVNTNLVNGELAININDGKLYYKDNGGVVQLIASKAGASGSVTTLSVVSANGFAGTVANATTTPAITLTTSVTGVLKGNGTAISAAVSGTDYAPATSGTSILYGNGSGGFSNVTVGSGLSFAGGTLSSSGGSGTVTSVAQSFTGGIISVSGSPITTSGTLALTVAGTSGGIPYFSSGTTWASSAALDANALVVGGGAGAAPATVTTGTGVVTALGVNTGSAGAFVVNGGALGTPSSGTVTNLTGTASININGTVGATTANTGAFTTLSATGVTTVQAGTVSAPAITTSGDTNTGIFFPAADTIAFTEGGVESMRIDSSGNVGIGVVPNGSYKLQVNGQINGTSASITGANSGAIYVQDSNTAFNPQIQFIGTNRTFQLGTGNSASGFNNQFFIYDGTAAATRMIIDSSGNVGIGTSSPGSALDVKGTLRLSGSTSGYVGLSPAAAAGSTTYTLPATDGTTGQVLSTNGSGALSWATAGGGFPAGTLMLFQQTSAPTGWTKQTTHDNKALRVVSGSASSGGSVAFTTAFASQGVSGTVGSTTLSTSQIPSHTHTGTFTGGGCSGGNPWSPLTDATSQLNTGATGGGGSHNHSFSGTAINLAVSYVDLIIASKT
jgi:trimeric autotransporter adhesin